MAEHSETVSVDEILPHEMILFPLKVNKWQIHTLAIYNLAHT